MNKDRFEEDVEDEELYGETAFTNKVVH